MVKHLLLAALSTLCTYVVAMDGPSMPNHPYHRLSEEDKGEEGYNLYPGYLEVSQHYENMDKEELYRLGLQYYNSPTKDNDLKKARLILKLAEERDQPQAAETLGDMWEKGEGGAVNLDEAKSLYSKAGRLGLESANMRLAAIHKRANEIDLAYKLYAPLAIKGNVAAQIGVANIILIDNTSGKINVTPEEMTQAFEWCLHAAGQGFAPAQTALGTIFLKGISSGQNKFFSNTEEAIKWYTKAAKQGDTYAEYKLGSIYFGIKNIPEAVSYLKKVVENEKAEQVLGKKRLAIAAHKLAYIYHDGYKEGKYLIGDVKKAYQKAIDLGSEQAKKNLKTFNIELAQKKGILPGMRARLPWSSPSKMDEK
ncbi:tetratricopeptide repeat protein [Candidatus Paracaedibacter symbiosus]|uniref:tetratricopeptide repeat protein n=1 Tax=Candidatus Paracaedibacter symbiosus TaxID=244582 RepID=UPI000509F3B7|nr:tetratricopeptide repeat protein [Candidatus Paracaedibacter symbiosus]